MYEVTDKQGNIITEGDEVTSFRGEPATFVRVSRGVEYNGTAKVVVSWSNDGNTSEYYDGVFDLTVKTLSN